MDFIRLLPLVLVVILFSCTGKKETGNQLGDISFTVTATDSAAKAFHHGLLLLHSFEYGDAAEAFRKAQKLDSTCAMAFWGEAMTYNHSLWGEQDYEKALTVLNRLAASPDARRAKAATEIERDFISAVDVLYGNGAKPERDKAYSQYMAGLFAKYPDNHEVASFYALSLMGAVPVGRDEEIYKKGALIAGEILKQNPRHPGALHYLIHADDDPAHAAEALEAANLYSKVAPAAGHALHMPSHIYLGLGMWEEVVTSNESSWQASVARKERKGLDNEALDYHSLHWLMYGYLQQGRYDTALHLVGMMSRFRRELPTDDSDYYHDAMRVTYGVATGRWNDLADAEGDDNLGFSISDHYFRGLKAFHNKDSASLREVIDQMEAIRNKNSARLNADGIALCSSAGAQIDLTRQRVDQAHVMEMEMQALLSMMVNDYDAAEQWLKDATVLEDGLSFVYGPPFIAKPSHEMYAEFLLGQNRLAEAKTHFEATLKRAPRRILALKGLLEVGRLSNDREAVKAMEKELQSI